MFKVGKKTITLEQLYVSNMLNVNEKDTRRTFLSLTLNIFALYSADDYDDVTAAEFKQKNVG